MDTKTLDLFKIKVCHDSRDVTPGAYFVPIKGDNQDGHAFIPDALQKGAVGVIEENQLYDLVKRKINKLSPKIIGITGSVGKTTAKEALTSILTQKFNTYSSVGNRNTLIGLSVDFINLCPEKTEYLVLEMGMDRENEIFETCQIFHPNISVITNIHENHMEKLGSLEKIINTKSGIIDLQTSKEITFINYDDPNSRTLILRGESRKITYSTSNTSADFYTSNSKVLITKTSAVVSKKGGIMMGKIEIPIPGSYNLSTIALCAAVSSVLGLTPAETNLGLSKLKPQPGRQKILIGINGAKVIDDTYNASLQSAIKLVDLSKQLSKGNFYLVLGDMLELGTFEKEAHKRLVEYAMASGAKKIFLVGSRLQRAYLEIKKTAQIKAEVTLYKNSEVGKSKILSDINLKNGDVVGIKGSRGIKMENFLEPLVKGAKTSS